MHYLAPLDGIRGIAIITVAMSHFGVPMMMRGGFGVDMFFTLSGFLITSILLREYAKTGDIDFRNFYIRRVLRLFPALLFLLLVYGVLVTLFGSNLTRHFTDIALVFFYVANWAGAAGLNRPGELAHTWSLSIEEQFYLVWPIILFIAIKKWGGKGLFVVASILCLLSVTETYVMSGYWPWWRIHYGFDTRAFTLLFGCCLSVAFHVWKDRIRLPNVLEKLVSPVGFIGIALFMISSTPFTSDPDFFRSKIFAIPLLTCCLLYAAVSPGFSITKKILSTPVLVYFGKKSYGLYLWHFWLLSITNPNSVGSKIICVAASLIMTELSYRFIEMPFLKLKDKFALREKVVPSDSAREPVTA